MFSAACFCGLGKLCKMNTPTDALSAALLDALEAFDKQTLPLGLYACDEFQMKDRPFPRLHQEWHLCLKPCLEARGCRLGYIDLRDGQASFTLPEGTRVEMHLVRTSKIKVRKFGSAYRVDSHNKYHERWQALRLDRELSGLWKPSALAESYVGLRLFLFIGFAAEAEPFGKELGALDAQLEWDKHGAGYQTRVWADRQDRRFFVRLSLWSRANPQEPGGRTEG